MTGDLFDYILDNYFVRKLIKFRGWTVLREYVSRFFFTLFITILLAPQLSLRLKRRQRAIRILISAMIIFMLIMIGIFINCCYCSSSTWWYDLYMANNILYMYGEQRYLCYILWEIHL